MLRLLFPPKCVLCRKLLTAQETDLCHNCRKSTPEFRRAKRHIPFIAHWTALWYYKEDVRKSIHRFKFGSAKNYADTYGRLLAVKLQPSWQDVDILTWVPVSTLRRLKRGYDQSSLLAKALGQELSFPTKAVLKKVRHTPPQSGIRESAQRKANVLNAYRVLDPATVRGKTILLVDDVVTTGATASECARTLMTAGAKQVYFAAIAAVQNDNNK